MHKKEKFVISGTGILSSIGVQWRAFCDNLMRNSMGRKKITNIDIIKYGEHFGGEITEFIPEKFLGKKGFKYLSRSSQLFMSAAFMALNDGGIKNDNREYIAYDAESIGIILGTTFSVLHSTASFDRVALVEGPQYVSPMAFPNLVMNSHAGYLAIKENIQGLNITVSTGYNASLDAIGLGCEYLISNEELKCLVVGGVEELSEELFLWYSKRALITSDSTISEGSGVFVLERYENAVRRKAKIYGIVAGYGNANGIDDCGLGKAIELAINDAEINKSEIDAIIKSSSISQNEKIIESKVVDHYFGTRPQQYDFSKNMGDCYSAGGSLQVGAALGLLEKKIANKILVVTIDPCYVSSAMIINRANIA